MTSQDDGYIFDEREDRMTEEPVPPKNENWSEGMTDRRSAEATTLNIYQRMNNVMGDVRYIQKRPGTKHATVSHDDVVVKVRDYLVKHGVHMSISTLEHEFGTVQRSYRSGSVDMSYTQVRIGCCFTNTDNPEEKIYEEFWGHGESSNEMSVGGAYSFAVKTLILKTFLIPTGEEEEGDAYKKWETLASKEEAAAIAIVNAIDEVHNFIGKFSVENDVPLGALYAYFALNANHRVEDIPDPDFARRGMAFVQAEFLNDKEFMHEGINYSKRGQADGIDF